MVKNRLGEWNSAEILLYSVNFEEVLRLQNQNKWKELIQLITNICKKLEIAGSKAVLFLSNTMHKIVKDIEPEISVPIINVIDETAKIIKSMNIENVGLLGTKFTMEGEFYVVKLLNQYKIKTTIPNELERDYIHKVIYEEFAKGKFHESTKRKILNIIENLRNKGAEGIILGCTELPLLITSQDVSIPLYDTLKIHLRAAVDFALS